MSSAWPGRPEVFATCGCGPLPFSQPSAAERVGTVVHVKTTTGLITFVFAGAGFVFLRDVDAASATGRLNAPGEPDPRAFRLHHQHRLPARLNKSRKVKV